MNTEKLQEVLEKHQLWLKGYPKGERANLEWAHLEGAHLEWAHLEGARLEGARLEGARLERANLEGANLEGARLEWARLEGAHLERANLAGAILDFSCFPLWCGSFNAKGDDRLVLQLFAHITRLDLENCSKDVKKLVEKLPELAKNGFCKYRTDVKTI